MSFSPYRHNIKPENMHNSGTQSDDTLSTSGGGA